MCKGRIAFTGLARLSLSGTIMIPNLKPEISISYEGGVDLAFLGNKVWFSGTYYYIENKNQILSNAVPPSSFVSSLCPLCYWISFPSSRPLHHLIPVRKHDPLILKKLDQIWIAEHLRFPYALLP